MAKRRREQKEKEERGWWCKINGNGVEQRDKKKKKMESTGKISTENGKQKTDQMSSPKQHGTPSKKEDICISTIIYVHSNIFA